MSRVNFEKLNQRHKQMLYFQSQIDPFVPTIRELVDVWGINSTSHAKYILDEMDKHGMVKTREHGNSKSYYAV